MKTIHDRNLSGCDISNHFRNEERAEFRSDSIFCLSIAQHFFFKSMNTTDTYTIYYSDFNSDLLFRGPISESAIASLAATMAYCVYKSILRTSLRSIKSAPLNPFTLTSKLCFEFRRIEMSNRSCSADTVHKVFPCFGNSVTHRSKRTKTCYYNSFLIPYYKIKDNYLALASI